VAPLLALMSAILFALAAALQQPGEFHLAQVCEVRGHRLSGLVGFLMYVGVHVFYLGNINGQRTTRAITAIGSLFGARRSRVMPGELASVERSTASSEASEALEAGPAGAAA